MKRLAAQPEAGRGTAGVEVGRHGLVTEMLLLSDGRVLVHNLTPTMAQLLRELGLEEGRGLREAPPGLPPGGRPEHPCG